MLNHVDFFKPHLSVLSFSPPPLPYSSLSPSSPLPQYPCFPSQLKFNLIEIDDGIEWQSSPENHVCRRALTV